jgi:outer membrane protein assembly factor BamB
VIASVVLATSLLSAEAAQTDDPDRYERHADEAGTTNSAANGAGDVTTYRGDLARTGAMPGPGPAGEPVVRWTFQTGRWVYADPAVVAGMVYVCSGDGALYALDAATGDEVWHAELGDQIQSPPTVVDGVVYVGSMSNDPDEAGSLVALDAATGEERWTYDAGAGVYTAPAVVGDLVVVTGSDGVVHAVGTEEGEVHWQARVAGSPSSSVAVAAGLVHVVASELGDGSDDWTGTVYALDLETGEERWTYEVAQFLTGPAVAAGVVYVAHAAGVIAIDAESGVEVWSAAVNDLGSNESVGAPAVAGSGVYVGGRSLVALDAESGDEVWRFQPPLLDVPGDPDPGDVASAPAVVGETVFVSGTSGLYAVDAASGELIWKVGETGTWTTNAVVTGGVVYGGTHDGKVLAIGNAANNRSRPGR